MPMFPAPQFCWAAIFFPGASIFSFHGCSHCPQKLGSLFSKLSLQHLLLRVFLMMAILTGHTLLQRCPAVPCGVCYSLRQCVKPKYKYSNGVNGAHSTPPSPNICPPRTSERRLAKPEGQRLGRRCLLHSLNCWEGLSLTLGLSLDQL